MFHSRALLTAIIFSLGTLVFISAACTSPADPIVASSDTGQQADTDGEGHDAEDATSDVPSSDDAASSASSDVRIPSHEDEEYDEDCHYDCFGDFSCREGRVYEHPHAPIPCDHPDYDERVAECEEGVLVGECEQGCAEPGNYRYNPLIDEWTIMCEEGRPRVVADPCETGTDCEPAMRTFFSPSDDPGRPLVCDETSRNSSAGERWNAG